MKNLVMVLLAVLLISVLLVPTLSTSAAVPGPTPTAAPVATVSAVPLTENCTEAHGIKFCVKGLAKTKEYTYVMLEIKTPPNIGPQEDTGFLASALIGDGSPSLQDEQGNKKTLLDGRWYLTIPGVDHQTYQQILKFSRLDQAAKRATLKFPVVAFSIPANVGFVQPEHKVL